MGGLNGSIFAIQAGSRSFSSKMLSRIDVRARIEIVSCFHSQLFNQLLSVRRIALVEQRTRNTGN